MLNKQKKLNTIAEAKGYWKYFAENFGPIFPCNADKTPKCMWQQDATTDIPQIYQWIEESWPNVHFGMMTGSESGIVVVDIDVKKEKKGFEFMEKKLKDLPRSIRVRTPSGGEHIYFKKPMGVEIRNAVDIFGKDSGIDIRSDGGYVIAPFSLGYKYFGKSHIKYLADMPQNLVDIIKTEERSQEAKKPKDPVPFDTVKRTLYRLNPDHPELVGRDGWQKVLRSVHSATDGSDEGKWLFTEWSLSGKEVYEKDVEAEIHRDWDSYSEDGPQTFGTLSHMAQTIGKPFVDPTPQEDCLEFPSTNEFGTFMTNAKGKIKNVSYNVTEFLASKKLQNGEDVVENKLYDLFHYNELSGEVCWTRSEKSVYVKSKRGMQLDDRAITGVQQFMTRFYEVDMSGENVQKGIEFYAHRHTFHPVKDYLASLVWDGQPRIDNWIIKYCNVSPSRYHKAVGRNVLLSAVARVMKSGSKVDECMVLEGPQGCRKSTMVEVMGFAHIEDREWYSAPELNIKGLSTGDSSAITNTFGSWIIEVAEMKSFTHSDESAIKRFMSTSVDTVTLKYDKYKTNHRRSFILVGTINPFGEGRYIKDESGARRFWPVRVRRTIEHPIDIDSLKAEMDQLYAEAYARYMKGEKWHMQGKDLVEAKQQQKMRIVRSGLSTDIEKFFQYGDGKSMRKFHNATIYRRVWPLERKISQFHRDSLTEYMLKQDDWKASRGVRVDGKQSAGWYR